MSGLTTLYLNSFKLENIADPQKFWKSMAAAPNFPTYKWWETDDKTKRLYTELLAEKLSSPRKGSSSLLNRKPSNGKDIGSRLTSSPKHTTTSVNTKSTKKDIDRNKEEKGENDNKYGKYTFETITIDTLAKYDYIKSPQKRAAPMLPLSFFEQSVKAATKTSGTNENNERKEGVSDVTQLSNGHFLISQKLSSAKNELQESNSTIGEKQTNFKEDGMKKDKPSRTMKLEELPEHTSSESSESSADEAAIGGASRLPKQENKSQMLSTDDKEASETKQVDKSIKPFKIEELSTKFQLLSEEVAQLEFKMFEFADDIQKLKQNFGFTDAATEERKEGKAKETMEKKNECGVTHQRSLSFADKFNSKAMLMKQQASPSKMLAAKAGKFMPGKFTLEYTSKEDAMAALKKNETLNETVSKIKEQELSEDDIQEILRCAKDKYIDKPNYLEQLGYSRKND